MTQTTASSGGNVPAGVQSDPPGAGDLPEAASYTAESTFESVAELAQRIGDSCRTISGDLADTVHICVAEALNNIVEHAYEQVPGKTIAADVSLTPGLCAITLRDEGLPMPGNVLPDGTISFDVNDIDALPEGGFGWMLILTQMDEVSYQRSGSVNILRLEKACDRT